MSFPLDWVFLERRKTGIDKNGQDKIEVIPIGVAAKAGDDFWIIDKKTGKFYNLTTRKRWKKMQADWKLCAKKYAKKRN